MNKINKKILITASILGAMTIGIGAFGAHGLKSLVDGQAAQSFETGVRYQMYHVLVLLLLVALPNLSEVVLKRLFWIFVSGILFFSGSIYLLALQEILPFSVKFLGPVTPLGGLLFMGGWFYLAYAVFRRKDG